MRATLACHFCGTAYQKPGSVCGPYIFFSVSGCLLHVSSTCNRPLAVIPICVCACVSLTFSSGSA